MKTRSRTGSRTSSKTEVKSSFKNEVGKPIKVTVKHAKDTATNYKTGRKLDFNAVSISMIGPSSTCENIVTPMEAKALLKCLKIFLRLKLK